MAFDDSPTQPTGSARLVEETNLEWRDGACHYCAADGQSPSEAVLSALEACREREDGHVPLTDRPPLFRAVDPDALDELFASTETRGRVDFVYDDYDVTVTSEGTVTIR